MHSQLVAIGDAEVVVVVLALLDELEVVVLLDVLDVLDELEVLVLLDVLNVLVVVTGLDEVEVVVETTRRSRTSTSSDESNGSLKSSRGD
jgi:hypothetical protein